MESSSYTLHLAVAALVGASFAAASAYYMHRKTLDQLLRFARSIDRDTRRRSRLLTDSDYDHTDGEEDEPPLSHRDHDRRTMPIPPGLPPLHTGRESRPVISPGSTKRIGAMVRPTTPKSSVPTVSAFERIEDSDDEEDIVPDAKNDDAYLSTNGAIESDPLPDKVNQNGELKSHHFEMVDGVIQVFPSKDSKERLFPVADATTFFTDMHYILRVLAAGDIRTKFNLHLMVNADRELLAQKAAPHRDFYNVRKVDTHVHHSACMNQKHLLRFIKSKLRKEPDEVVIFRDGTYLTLKEVFESLDLTGYDLNVDLLDVHADKSTFHRFDKFNLKYNPCGQSRLREIFLKQDNLIQGRFLAELTKEVFSDLEASKYQVVGLDLVDDESKPERRPTKHMPTPEQWTNVFNPAYAYYVYYCYANLYTLNKLRESKGMTTIKLRPHCGEAGDVDHLAAAFLTCHNIAHGVNLRKSPVLQYLYYLAQLWKLSSCDLCEIARNSVCQSGFSHRLKSHWIGRNYYRRGPEGNDIHQTNVPHIRVEFRHNIWKEEMELIHLGNVELPEEIDR
ncbi:hypothetical protein PR202_gb22113 [Eleusine coracana subsp. coracana]|uniref:AMP deaminase n=1 Tax=Eleusine coracana subsp. coracana TaxID=191504 RepID=A0AAV5FCU4_ELECO|nr:hypothetical protein PR202_gb22113 [Eleusine coracana subsp. coracana]